MVITERQRVEEIKYILSAEQVRFFQKNGYIHIKNFIERYVVQEYIEEINRIQSDFIANKVEKIHGIPLRYGRNIDGSPMIQRMAFASYFSKPLRDFLNDHRLKMLLPLLGDYEGRIGEDEKDGLVVNQYLNSLYSEFRNLGWHTDSPRDLFHGSRILPMLNVGLHLDDCPSSNGGLRVIPGTHKQGLFSLFFKKTYFMDHKPDPNEVSFEIEAGDLTIHDGSIWHRVQESPFQGIQSMRRVMYIPIITGKYSPKNENSPTPFYHKLTSLIKPKREKETEQTGYPKLEKKIANV
jgi:phytanoyl-CoA hydroxylase